MLFLAAIFVDAAQIGIDMLGIGFGINPFLDVMVGGALWLLFFMKGMLYAKLFASLLFAFAIDQGTGGIFPAWTLDIAYAWLINDGAGALRAIPFIGGKVQKAVQTVAKGS